METYSQWLDACLQCGIPAISTDTAARILAVVYLCSNNENFTHNGKLKADIDYICKRWHIEGGESVSNEIHPLIRQYSKEIETCIENFDKHTPDFFERCKGGYPQWCEDLIYDRYGFLLFQ